MKKFAVIACLISLFSMNVLAEAKSKNRKPAQSANSRGKVVCQLTERNNHGITSVVGKTTLNEATMTVMKARVSSGLNKNIYPVNLEFVVKNDKSLQVDMYYDASFSYSWSTKNIAYVTGEAAPNDVQEYTKIVSNPTLNERFGAVISQRISGLKVPFEVNLTLVNSIKNEFPANIVLLCK